jgi:hypothetical protein
MKWKFEDFLKFSLKFKLMEFKMDVFYTIKI